MYSRVPAETPANDCSVSLTRVTNALPATAPLVTNKRQQTTSCTVQPHHPANNADTYGKLHPGTKVCCVPAAEFLVVVRIGLMWSCFLDLIVASRTVRTISVTGRSFLSSADNVGYRPTGSQIWTEWCEGDCLLLGILCGHVLYREFSCSVLLCFRLSSFHCSYVLYAFIVCVSVCCTLCAFNK